MRSGARAREGADGAIVLEPGERAASTPARSSRCPSFTARPCPVSPPTSAASSRSASTRRCRGLRGVYAAGDGTNFPIKHGGLGTQQADAAAEQIAARAGAPVEPTPFRPVIRGRLIAGDESVNLQADIAGGGGEGVASLDYLWWPPQKIAGKYLTAELTGRTPQDLGPPPEHGIEVEVSLDARLAPRPDGARSVSMSGSDPAS